MKEIHTIWMHGIFGAGKDTQLEKLNIPSISSGEQIRGALQDPNHRFRQLLTEGSDARDSQSGLLVTDTKVHRILRDCALDLFSESSTIGFSGAIRTDRQRLVKSRYIKTIYKCLGVKLLEDHIVLVLPPQLANARAEKRYNEALEKGETPRADDKPAKRANRLHEYVDKTSHALTNLFCQVSKIDCDLMRQSIHQILTADSPILGSGRFLTAAAPSIDGTAGGFKVHLIDAAGDIDQVHSLIKRVIG